MTGAVGYAEVADPEPAALTFGAFVEEVARRYGSNVALSFGQRRLTYDELYAEVCEFARALIGAGAGKGTRVALLVGNRPEWPIAAYAVGMIGGVLIPVSTFAEPDEREYILRHSDSAILLTQDALARHRYVDDLLEIAPEAAGPAPIRAPRLPALRQVYVLGTQPRAEERLPSWHDLRGLAAGVPEELRAALAAEVSVADEAIVIYTSGTTAVPKAVLHAQRSFPLQSWRVSVHTRLTAADRVWSTFPLFWTAGQILGLGVILAVGARVVMTERFDAGEALELIEHEAITAVVVAAHQEVAIAEHPDARARDLSSLSCLGVDSPLRALPGVNAPRTLVRSAYGSSETFTFATSTPADAPEEIQRSAHGRPFPGIEVRIIDSDSGASLPVDETGEIVVRGKSIMSGYYKVPRDECFDPDGFFHTRDAGRIDADGYLHWEGRMSGMIKTAGANVSPIEIENALNEWGRVRMPMAIGVPHPLYGEAVVVCAIRLDGDEVSEDEVRAHLRQRLASYRVPRRVLFVGESDLPFSNSQMKVRLDGLRQLAARIIADEADPADEQWVAYLREHVLAHDAGAGAA